MKTSIALTMVLTCLHAGTAASEVLTTRPALAIADLGQFEYTSGFCFNPDLETLPGESEDEFTAACLAGAGDEFADVCQIARVVPPKTPRDTTGVFLRCSYVTGIDFPERQVFVWGIDHDPALLQALAASGDLVRARFTSEYFGTLLSVEALP